MKRESQPRCLKLKERRSADVLEVEGKGRSVKVPEVEGKVSRCDGHLMNGGTEVMTA